MFRKHWDKMKNTGCLWQVKSFWSATNWTLHDTTEFIHLYGKTLGVIIGNVTSSKTTGI